MRLSRAAAPLLTDLRAVVAAEVAQAIESLLRHGSDAELNRVNVLAFAGRHGLAEEAVIAAFLHAAHGGLFEMSWNVLCPGCGGVLGSGATLRTVDRSRYGCALCAGDYEPTLDEMVEVTFTVSPRIRRIAAHRPQTLPLAQYQRQVVWGSGLDLPDDAGLARVLDDLVLVAAELPAGEDATLACDLPAEFIILFEPVTHSARFIDVQGAPVAAVRELEWTLDGSHTAHATLALAPGPLRLTVANRSRQRALPGVWVAGDRLHRFLGRRRPFLTAKRLLTNQTFRDIFRHDTLELGQRLKITSLTFLFTDLKGSTELYERVGDLVAYDLVRAHFRILQEIVASEAGAVVKTIGDAVMATFPTPDRALAAALRMREAVQDLDRDLLLKIGIHEGPCLAVVLNEQQDYFGQTVNIAARVQKLARSQSILATARVFDDVAASRRLQLGALRPRPLELALQGVSSQVRVYELQ